MTLSASTEFTFSRVSVNACTVMERGVLSIICNDQDIRELRGHVLISAKLGEAARETNLVALSVVNRGVVLH